MTYVKIASWHIEAMTFRGGAVKTRCGRTATPVGTLAHPGDGPIVVHATSDTLPLDERSCETCLRLNERDESR